VAHTSLPVDAILTLSLLPRSLSRALDKLPIPSWDMVILLRAMLVLLCRKRWATLVGAQLREADVTLHTHGLAVVLKHLTPSTWGMGHWKRGPKCFDALTIIPTPLHERNKVPPLQCSPGGVVPLTVDWCRQLAGIALHACYVLHHLLVRLYMLCMHMRVLDAILCSFRQYLST
jgi:hypothetical protein